MANKKKANHSRASIKKEIAQEITESLTSDCFHDNPIKRQIKLKQFPWTQKQKEFYSVRCVKCKSKIIDRTLYTRCYNCKFNLH